MHVVWTEHGGSDDGIYIDHNDSVMWLASNVGDAKVPSGALTACISFPDKSYMEFIEMVETGGASGPNAVSTQSRHLPAGLV